ncbi:SDR family oxidoreductase [Vibrio sp. HN007]|uniref:SDR family oxidoreductase n=1 Tax=Vibrio iocasae TaxID=3098914 RepID=UPI0035D508F8
MDINNSVVLITSAGSPLGGILANHFARLGANIILSDTDENKLKEVSERCKSISDNISDFLLPDHSDHSVQELLHFVSDKYSNGIDVLINYWPSNPFPTLTSDVNGSDFSETYAKFASSLFNYGQACALQMRDHEKNGVIVNILSLCDNKDTLGIDNASSIVSGMTKSWAKELNQFNIRVGGVVPSLSHSANDESLHWSELNDELIRNTEYIVSNDYFSGRVVSAEV